MNDGEFICDTVDNFETHQKNDPASEWNRMCQLAAASATATATVWLQLTAAGIALHTSKHKSTPASRNSARRAAIRNIIGCEQQCFDLLRLSPYAFHSLVSELKNKTNVKDFRNSSIEEQLITFLLKLGHNLKHRVVRYILSRSGETISRYFHNILYSVISLEEYYVKGAQGKEVQPRVLNSHRFYPYFKDCLGAIDGTHVRVKVSMVDAPRYRGRKEWPTQNVLAACTFDMKFTYILAGWEGSASNSGILQNALTREEPLVIPEGKFYLGDSGFGLTDKLLTPYGRTRYHLIEYSQRGPETPEELFNHRHSSLRNAIERAFGVLKKRFPIIASGSECQYSCGTMTSIILACTVLHNFMLTIDGDEGVSSNDDSTIDEDENVLPHDVIVSGSAGDTTSEYRRGQVLRDRIAREIWAEYEVTMTTPQRLPSHTMDSTERSPKNFRWAQQYEDTLLELLVKEARQGNRPDQTFTASAYRTVVKEFNKKHGTRIMKKHIQRRITTMKIHFVMFHVAFNGLSGFAWNPETKMFEAEVEMWDQRIQESLFFFLIWRLLADLVILNQNNPELAKLPEKACHNWDKLYELYGDTRATGNGAVPLKVNSKRIKRGLPFRDVHMENQDRPNVGENECSSFGEQDLSTDYPTLPATPDYVSTQNSEGSTHSKQKRKASMLSVMQDGYTTVAQSIKELSVAISTSSKPDLQLNGQLYEALATLELEEAYRMRAYCFLCEHPLKAAILVATPVDIRAHVLLDIMKEV